MAFLGHPNYKKSKIVLNKELMTKDDNWFIENYVVVQVDFNFSEKVKYPSIPCYLDKTTTVYPLSGEALLTGPEFLLAKTQKCDLKIKQAVCVPFKRFDNQNTFESVQRPYFDIIKDLQTKRREYKKGTLENLLYKEMANSIYGNVVRGISTKKVLDIKTGSMVYLEANELSNPILGSYTTAFIRSVIGETLHNIHNMGGKIVSVTTDGFITDTPDLESKLLRLHPESIKLLKIYRDIRKRLSGVEDCYESKNDGVGIISWATRGQLGIGSDIKAATGFQMKGYRKVDLVDSFINIMGSDNRRVEFIQKALRGGNEIYKKGGHVVMKYMDREFSLCYDNRRKIIEDPKVKNIDMSCNLLESEPLKDKNEALTYREISKILTKTIYSRYTTKTSNKGYKTVLESAVRTFIKGLLAEKPMFGLDQHRDQFKTYKDIIDFVRGFEKTKKISLTKSGISNLRHRKLMIKPVDRTPDIKDFIDYVKSNLGNFKEDEFFK
jgi:hypothetical protein